MRILWLGLGLFCVALGMVGVILPLLPTVPFLLLATFFFARSSQRLHGWLLGHPHFGPAIVNWHEKGAISRKAKKLATISVALVFSISIALGLRPLLLVTQGLVLGCVLIFLWTRPSD
ncbi:MAG: YbaN family protein [Roseovarius sp.]